jgi:tetratricopeptide (TPR) repeat protein
MHDVDEEIREIKKEIIESRGLVIKTNNLTNALAADIKSIAKRQAGYERAFTFHSAAAYVLFAGLAFLGLHMAYDVKVREVQSAKAAVERREKRLKKEVGQFRTQIDERIAAEGQAEALYQLIRERKRAEAVHLFSKIQNLQLSRVESAFLRDTIDTFRGELSMQAYREGLENAGSGRWPEAVRAYEEARRIDDHGPHMPEVELGLAEGYSHIDRAREALSLLEAIGNNPENRTLADDVLYQTAQAHIALEEYEDARETLRNLIRRFPHSRLSKAARDLYQDIVGRN